MKHSSASPIVSIVGLSGVGKTSLIEKLIPALTRRGLKVGTIKHDVHGFEMDKPGKDSWRHKHAGAAMSVISSPSQIAMVKDVERDHDLHELAKLFEGVDIVLAEGYKRSNVPKLEVFRPEVHHRPVCGDDPELLALISDTTIDLGVPRFSSDDPEGIASFLVRHFSLNVDAPMDHFEAVS